MALVPHQHVLVPPRQGEDGPAMAGLEPEHRRFVLAMCDLGSTNYTQALRAAGCVVEGEDAATTRQRAHRWAHHPAIIAAVREEAKKRIEAGVLMAASQLVSIAENPMHRGQLKAIEMLLGRGGLPAVSEVNTTVNVVVREEDKIERVQRLAAQLGLDPVALLGRAGVNMALDKPKEIVGICDDVTSMTDEMRELFGYEAGTGGPRTCTTPG